MFRFALGGVLGVVLCLGASDARAIDLTVSVKGGLALPGDGDASGDSDFSVEYEAGMVGSLAVGAALPVLPLRFEGELLYTESDVEDLSGTANSSGSADVTALMANGYVEVPSILVNPYIGLGLGMAQLGFNDIQGDGNRVFDADDTVLAYQAMLGADLSVTGVPLSLTAEYRYFDTSALSATDQRTNTSFDMDYSAHMVLVGARWEF